MSLGPMAGAVVFTCTITGVVSGKASIGNWRNAATPVTTKSAASTNMSSR